VFYDDDPKSKTVVIQDCDARRELLR